MFILFYLTVEGDAERLAYICRVLGKTGAVYVSINAITTELRIHSNAASANGYLQMHTFEGLRMTTHQAKRNDPHILDAEQAYEAVCVQFVEGLEG